MFFITLLGILLPTSNTRSGRTASGKRVVFALNSYSYGGVEEHVVTLCGSLPSFGYDPVVICNQIAGLQPLYDRLERLGVRRIAAEEGGGGAKAFLGCVRRTQQMLAELCADIVHVQLVWHDGGRIPIAAAARAGIPVVVTHHIAPSAPISLRQKAARYPFIRGVRRYIAVSDANRQLQIERMGLPPDRLVRIHNGITAPKVDRSAAREALRDELGLGAETPLIGCVGRLVEQKGLKYLIEAAPAISKALPDVRFVFAGEGPLLEALKQQAELLGVGERMIWLGFRTDSHQIIAALDALAMPSEFEGLPITLLEAMAIGTPVVAHSVDGIPEAVDDGVEGFLVPRGDAGQLAARLIQVLSDREMAERLGNGARERVAREFTAEVMAGKTASLYDEVLREFSLKGMRSNSTHLLESDSARGREG